MNITTVANMVLPKAKMNDFDVTFVQNSTSVPRLNVSAKNPPFSTIPELFPAMKKKEEINKPPQYQKI